MQSTSALYNSILAGNHSFEVKINISGTDYGMDVLTSLRSSRTVFGSGSPCLGLAPAGELSLSLYADSADIPRTAELRPYVRVVNDSDQSEWIPKGVYYVDTREADTFSGLVTLYAYDAMLKGEQEYPSVSHTWPYSDINTVTEIASFLGVAVDAQTTSLMTAGFTVPLPSQYTLRETLQYIAALYGGSFVITDTNTLRLIPLASLKSEADLTLGGTHRLTTAPAFPAVTGVRFLIDNDQEIFSGTETGYVFEITCPFATQTAADRLLTEMQGFVYHSKFRHDVPAVLHCIDAYCLPSLWEGLPIALLEAMAMGKAVIATPTDGTKELLSDANNGILIPFNNPMALADAILLFMENTAFKQECEQNARNLVSKRFNAQRVADSVQEIYTQYE